MPNQYLEPLESAQRLVAQLTLANATDLARRGQHAQAESLLADMLGNDTPNAAALDLLARVRAQQGRLLEADALWVRASEADPGNPAYPAARQCLAHMLRRPLWLRGVGLVLVCAAVLSTGALVAITIQKRAAAIGTAVRSVAEDVAQLEQRLGAQEADGATHRTMVASRLDEIAALSRESVESRGDLLEAQGKLRAAFDAAVASMDTQRAQLTASIRDLVALSRVIQDRISGIGQQLNGELAEFSRQLDDLAAQVAQASTTNSASSAPWATDIEFVPIHLPGSAETTFRLSKTEITLGQYRRFRPDHTNGPTRWGRSLDHPHLPVVNVSPEDAAAFCAWLSSDDGHRYRLPTEQEWERACRAGTAGKFFFGNDGGQLRWYAWYDDNASGLGVRKESRGPQVVAQKSPNPFGLHDMLGNVAEWCVSAQGGYVRCGGAWDSPAGACSCGTRDDRQPLSGDPHTGFRVVLDGAR